MLTEQQKALIEHLKMQFGVTVTRKQIIETAEKLNHKYPHWLLNSDCKVARGAYDVGMISASMSAPVRATTVDAMQELSAMPAAQVIPMPAGRTFVAAKLHTEVDSSIPEVSHEYVAFGFHDEVRTVLKTRIFFPIYISGLSGNGKTTMVEQVCARLKRECYRVNVSVETDEDALIGGHTLVDGNVVYREGPVLIAMRRGAVLLLDEVDRGSNKLICLQAILEGKPYFNKKTGEVIHPAPGFTVVATANTKGRGSDDGKFSAAQILDEAFLERFAIAIEQEYPTAAHEKKIVMNRMDRLGKIDDAFATRLVVWAEMIRKTYAAGGIDEVISTRRLVNIVEAASMFRDNLKAVTMCVQRFDAETRDTFVQLYNKLESGEEVVREVLETPAAAQGDEDDAE